MIEDIILVKLGGKVLSDQKYLHSAIDQFETLLYQKKILKKVLILPGGGDYANFIRKIDQKLSIDDDLAHWSAILAMDCNGVKLHEKIKNSNLISKFSTLKKKLKDERIASNFLIFQPLDFLMETDELPHKWDVTSDSIALYLANKLELNRCFLIKDVDGILDKNFELIKSLTTQKYNQMKTDRELAIFPKNATFIKKSKPIDKYSLELIERHNLECILLNGTHSDKMILKFFIKSSEKDKTYTKITK